MSDQIIPITRPTMGNSAQQKSESKFPTEVINLPSKGWFYSSDNPLSSGTLELKQMTAKEEDILTSPNLIEKNIVLDKLLDAVLVDKSIKAEEMLVCDRNAAFFALRRLAYGDIYDAKLTCPRCRKENSISIDLGKMDNKPFDFSKYTKGTNSFDFALPYGKNNLTFKLLTKIDEDAIERELEVVAKHSPEVSKEITTRLVYWITSVDGNSDKMKIRRFVENELLSKDSFALRKHIKETTPEIDSSFEFSCKFCRLERREDTPLGISFFWPNG